MCALYHYLSTDNIATIILCLSFPCLLPLCLSLSPFTVSFHWYSCYHSTAWWFPDHGSHGTTTLPHANASIASTCSTITTTFFFVVSARSVWLWKTNNNQTRSQYGVLGCPRRTKCAGTPNAKVLCKSARAHSHFGTSTFALLGSAGTPYCILHTRITRRSWKTRENKSFFIPVLAVCGGFSFRFNRF